MFFNFSVDHRFFFFFIILFCISIQDFDRVNSVIPFILLFITDCVFSFNHIVEEAFILIFWWFKHILVDNNHIGFCPASVPLVEHIS